jgi:hypothetical protein
MTDRNDPGFDPSDWLARQFGEEEAAEEEQAPSTPEPPRAPEPPGVPPQPPGPSGGFSWGLTPGAEESPAAPPPPPPAALPPASPALPTAPPAPLPTAPSIATPPPVSAPTDLPVAAPITPDAPTIAFADQAVEPAPWEPWQARPVDEALAGADDVIEAEIVGLDDPPGESNPSPGIDDLFGDTAFRDYGDEPIVSGPPPSGPKPPRAPKGERAPLPRAQKALLWVAGSLVAALALIALFLLGTRLPAALGPAPVLTASPTPSPTPSIIVIPAGPLPPGEYQWDELLGGECLDSFESAWQDRYTVVDCGMPHPAQMVARGRFEDAPGTAYPGVEELQTRINLLCTSATVINYQVAATALDIQVSASFPVDEEDWDEGNRTYFCFVDRASGENLTASVAVPQPAVTITPTPPTNAP